jgi:hypothetical protein
MGDATNGGFSEASVLEAMDFTAASHPQEHHGHRHRSLTALKGIPPAS